MHATFLCLQLHACNFYCLQPQGIENIIGFTVVIPSDFRLYGATMES
jgi:hypothetical protein